jgi:CDP-6-deoxy-D-xylo-4-hexulose-3-dehydrase
VLTGDPQLKKILMSLRDWGRDCWCATGEDNTCGMRFKGKFSDLPRGYDHKYVYSHVGYNLKATEMQAAIGLAQLDKLSLFIKARKNNFKSIYRIFEKYSEYFILPHAEKVSDPSWFGFPVTVRESAGFKRADIVNYLESRKIATRMLFGGNLTRQPAYRKLRCRVSGGLKNTDLVMNNMFWIGVYPGLTESMIGYIEDTLDLFFRKKR